MHLDYFYLLPPINSSESEWTSAPNLISNSTSQGCPLSLIFILTVEPFLWKFRANSDITGSLAVSGPVTNRGLCWWFIFLSYEPLQSFYPISWPSQINMVQFLISVLFIRNQKNFCSELLSDTLKRTSRLNVWPPPWDIYGLTSPETPRMQIH